jgi:uncharacterized integral membrane protein
MLIEELIICILAYFVIGFLVYLTTNDDDKPFYYLFLDIIFWPLVLILGGVVVTFNILELCAQKLKTKLKK